MQTKNVTPPTQESLSRQIWLNYYNDYLRDHGTITEKEWRRMRLAIDRSGPRHETRRPSEEHPEAKLEETEQEAQGMIMTMQ